MPTFKDKANRTWTVELNAPLVEEVVAKHDVDLTNLDKDPLISLRNNPMKLVGVIYLLCQKQIQTANLTPTEFGESLPSPPDPMLEAIADAIVNFSPTGRHLHVREVLATFGEMAAKTDQLAVTKMKEVMGNPTTMRRLDRKASQEIERAIDDLFPLLSGPTDSPTEGLI